MNARQCIKRTLSFQDLANPIRTQFSVAAANVTAQVETRQTVASNAQQSVFSDKIRVNLSGIQQISLYIHKQLFRQRLGLVPKELATISENHLRHYDLYGRKCEMSPEVAFDLPGLQGNTLSEHFYNISKDFSTPLVKRARKLLECSFPQRPKKWQLNSGWTRYAPGQPPKAVSYPLELDLIFDVETLYHFSQFPIFGTAASSEAWYCWISPWLLGNSESPRHLLPFGPEGSLLVGHNVGYDRARVEEEYRFDKAVHYFIDTMSLHIVINGMSNSQRSIFGIFKKVQALKKSNLQNLDIDMLLREHIPWIHRTTSHSLKELVAFYNGVELNKDLRDTFGYISRQEIVQDFQQYATYCADDVAGTHLVYQNLMEPFLDKCQHPGTFQALIKLNSLFLPVNENWEHFMTRADKTHDQMTERVAVILRNLAEKAVSLRFNPEIYENDPWYRNLDWSVTPIRMTQPKLGQRQVASRQKYPGFPKWYRDLFPNSSSEMKITLKTRIAPYLLKMSWEGHSLRWTPEDGWIFRVEDFEVEEYLMRLFTPSHPGLSLYDIEGDGLYFKLPHIDGPDARCGSPIGKQYFQYLDSEQLSSPIAEAREALMLYANCTYWLSIKERLIQQVVVYNSDVNYGLQRTEKLGAILPQTICMGTTTRRAVEKTWLTTSDAKQNRLGSESKAMIQAPDGYCFVGADVDSEELWIAAVIGDSQFKSHGATALGWMTLEGSKDEGTDLHSKTADILGVSRSDAKIFNYGRIYGAGMQFTARLLQQKNPHLSISESFEMAAKLYRTTKGVRANSKKRNRYWRGGSESYCFNKLESLARKQRPETPVLKAAITEVLQKRLVGEKFMTSRVNWAVQSSGVDYLHMLIISMEYLIKRHKLDARLSIAIHDEIRFISSEKDKYRTALALQISNLWVRAAFCQELGIYDIPQSCAFFSNVDVDKVLRKEVTMTCVTPSNPDPIPPGESLTIYELLKKQNSLFLTNEDRDTYFFDQECINYIDNENDAIDLTFLNLQSTCSPSETKTILKESKEKKDKPVDITPAFRFLEKEFDLKTIRKFVRMKGDSYADNITFNCQSEL